MRQQTCPLLLALGCWLFAAKSSWPEVDSNNRKRSPQATSNDVRALLIAMSNALRLLVWSLLSTIYLLHMVFVKWFLAKPQLQLPRDTS